MSYRENEPLFTEGDLRYGLDEHFNKVTEFVDAIPKERFQRSSDEDLYEHVHDKFVVTPLTLHEDQMTIDPPDEVQVDVKGYPNYLAFGDGPALVPGVRVTVWIPYTGDDQLWTIRPHSLWTISSRGKVYASSDGGSGNLALIITQPSGEPAEEVRRTIEQMLHPIRETLKNQRADIEWRNAKLPELIREAIAKRRKLLGKHEDLVRILAIPLRHKPDAPSIDPIRPAKRIPRPLPATPAAAPEPGIPSEEYDYILKVIRHVGCTFEVTPATYRVHDEEELRDILLAHLNGHFQGDATGETFRKHGKTDIRIESTNRAAFVAECKVWRGATELHEAIDQLQGYLTWRDCKAAIIIFNKKIAAFADIQTKIAQLFKDHRGFREEQASGHAGEWRFTLESAEDPKRILQVHVFLFNLYVRESDAA